MRGIAALLSCLALPVAPALSETGGTDLADEAACFEGRATFADCFHAIREASTVVSTERPIEGTGSVGRLQIAYVVTEFGALRDGMDPGVSAFLKFDYLIDGQRVRSTYGKVGSFLSFDSFERAAPGRYLLKGQIFSDEGCVTSRTYHVDAADLTVALRRNDATLPELQIETQTGTCD